MSTGARFCTLTSHDDSGTPSASLSRPLAQTRGALPPPPPASGGTQTLGVTSVLTDWLGAKTGIPLSTRGQWCRPPFPTRPPMGRGTDAGDVVHDDPVSK